MSNLEENKKLTLRKVFSYGVVVFLLIVLPAMSYWYLSKGFSWRVKAQSELQDFGKIPSAPIMWPDGTKDDQLKGKICVIHQFDENPDLTPTNKQLIDTGVELVKQFGYKTESVRNDFRIVMISNGGTAAFKNYAQSREGADLSNWIWAGASTKWKTVLNESYQYYCSTQKVTPYPEFYALADTFGIIRRFYNAGDKNEVNRMVQQIAIIIPKQF